MRNISDTMSRLAAIKARPGTAPRGKDRLTDLTAFGSNPGTLLARTYIPKNLAAGAPLVVVLHGCTQNAAGYDQGSGWSQLADRHGFALLFPEQQRMTNPNLCFNWFVPDDIRRDGGEVLSIRQMIEAVAAEHAIDRTKIFVTGLSAGGAMAAALLATCPDLFAGGAIIAGLPFGVAGTIPQAFDRMRGHGMPDAKALQDLLRDASVHKGPWPAVSIWQGSADQTVAPSNADALVAQWRKVHKVTVAPTRVETVDGQSRKVWTDAGGNDVLELISIAGMGHGTPLDTRVCGKAMPFMIDAGISSTSHIAAFWGIAPEERAAERPAKARASQPSKPLDGEILPPARPGRQKAAPDATAAGTAGTTIAKVIDDALRAAGLLR